MDEMQLWWMMKPFVMWLAVIAGLSFCILFILGFVGLGYKIAIM